MAKKNADRIEAATVLLAKTELNSSTGSSSHHHHQHPMVVVVFRVLRGL
jgi:hypothetical protein